MWGIIVSTDSYNNKSFHGLDLLRLLTVIAIFYIGKALPMDFGSWTTEFAAAIRPIVSSRVFPAADIEEADLSIASAIPAVSIGSLFILLLSG